MVKIGWSSARLRAGSASAACLAVALLLAGGQARADGAEVGAVSTTFRLLGANDRIVVDRFDDPKVAGISCYVSHAVTGGVRGSIGIANNPSRFAITCIATGKVGPVDGLPASETVFGERQNFFFKELRVTRMVDPARHVLVYLAWSTKALSTGGSPYNAVSAVPFGAP